METTNVQYSPDELVPGFVLCDMHDGLSVLEERIPGFVLVNHARIHTCHGRHIVATLLGEAHGPRVVTPPATNKLLYLIEDGMLYKAVYYYDYTFFGIVTFKIS